MFDLFQRHRHHSLNWLVTNADECNQVMEDIVKIITFTSKTEQRQAEAAKATKDAALAAKGMAEGRERKKTIATVDHLSLGARSWHTMNRHNCVGRFIPDTEHFNDDEMNAILGGERSTQRQHLNGNQRPALQCRTPNSSERQPSAMVYSA